VNKHLLPIFDKPLIFYPLTNLILLGVVKILIISNEASMSSMQSLLGDGSEFGVEIEYQVQVSPTGIGSAPTLYEAWAAESPICLILGDNLFIGSGLMKNLRVARDAFLDEGGAHCFLQEVADPQRYGVAGIGPDGDLISIEEKPQNPPSSLAISGLYFMDSTAPSKAKSISRSKRGEFEITDLLQQYRAIGSLRHSVMPRGTVWLDAGTPDSLLEASQYVAIVQKRQRQLIGSPHEAAMHADRLSATQLQKILNNKPSSIYFDLLRNMLN
jgi:glucose-1-phosphate thymidylyltransferase